MKPFPSLERGVFIARPNRFLVECTVEGKPATAYLPNPGRLRELLFPGSVLYLTRREPLSHKCLFTCVAVAKDGAPVLLHTHANNSVARYLIEHGRIPGLEGAEIVQPEIAVGRSRFDFLLRHEGQDVLLEVKSCTLFSGGMAMFPDAATVRGRRHLEELASLSGGARKCAVLFIVHSPGVRWFLPDFHTDLEFARTLLSVSKSIMVKAVAVTWTKDLSLGSAVRELAIPWDLVRNEANDSGSYIVILRLKKDATIAVGNLGKLTFRKGFYLYVGTAKKNMSQRIALHQRKRKNLFWHVDYLRELADFCAALPLRAAAALECEVAGALNRITDWNMPGFGSSDCRCGSHLFGMSDDPLLSPRFINLLLHFRMTRLERLMKGDR